MSENEVKWHPYPGEYPDSGKVYLITVENEDGQRAIFVDTFMYLTGWMHTPQYLKVKAWAELPEPYQPEGKE